MRAGWRLVPNWVSGGRWLASARAATTRHLLLSALLAGCADGTAPTLLDGGYLLTSIDGLPVPHLREASLNCDVVVTSGILTIGPADEATLTIAETTDCTRVFGQVTDTVRTYAGSYTLDDRHLRFATTSSPVGVGVLIHGIVEGRGEAVRLDDPAQYAAGPGRLRLERATR